MQDDTIYLNEHSICKHCTKFKCTDHTTTRCQLQLQIVFRAWASAIVCVLNEGVCVFVLISHMVLVVKFVDIAVSEIT